MADAEQTPDLNIDDDVLLAETLNRVVSRLRDTDEGESVNDLLKDLDDEAIGHLLESVPADLRSRVWGYLPPERYWPVISGLQHDTISNLVGRLDDAGRDLLRRNATASNLLVFADALPDAMVDAILLDQDEDIADDLQQALQYEESQVGRYLNKNIMRVRPRVSLASFVERWKKREEVCAAYVVEASGEIVGHIPLDKALRLADERPVREIAEPVVAFDHDDEWEDLIDEVGADDQLAWYPVVRAGKVVGAVPVSAMLWELQDRMVAAAINDSPAGEEDLFTPVSIAARMRAIWLCVNLATAFLASWVIGWFEIALQQVVALAILMPVVASMGGIAGSQTLAVALRGLALNHITNANIRLLLNKEMRIAALNGVLLGLLIAVVVGIWFDSVTLGAIILVAIVINSLAAASSGTLIPFILAKFKIDPAISGAVILTTVTDVVGFMIFLGLGSLILVHGV